MNKSDNHKIIMTKDFEYWLKKDDFFEYYQNNPEQQQTIYIDYKREKEFIDPKYMEDWIEWMTNNPELAESKYPETMKNLIKRIKKKPPFVTALIIERIPEQFAKWKYDIDNCIFLTKKKKIRSYLELIDLVLHQLEFNSDIENNAVKKIKPELLEMEAYFKGLLNKPPKQQKSTTYQWQGNADKELPELYSLLVDEYKLIASDTTLEQFTDIFTGQSIDSIDSIKWSASKSLNAYFIEQLISKNKLSKAINTDVWEISKSCFIDGTNFSQLIDNYNNSKTGKPRNYNLIDDLLNAL